MSEHKFPAQLQRVHMVGIGGAGMSAIARILLARGAEVCGSDSQESATVAALRALGAIVTIGHHPDNLDVLPGGPTAVITTYAAIPDTNVELVEARRRGIPIQLRPVVLAQLMSGYRTVMITGSHGKTTTTSMIITALQHSGLDPSFAVGGELGKSKTNAYHGSGDCFVAEADESDGSLVQYAPDVAVVTNIEADHLDFFSSPQAYYEMFVDFVQRVRPGGAVVVCIDDSSASDLADYAAAQGIRVVRYGSTAGAGLAGELLSWSQQASGALARIRLTPQDGEPTEIALQLAVPGRHNALNALAALLAAEESGAPRDSVLNGLADFGGVRRRCEFVGAVNGIRIFDDYAHHPTEVRAALMALSPGAGARSIVVFQPHLYSRTQAFAREFGSALDCADVVFILDIYAAREQPLAGVSSAMIAEHVSAPVYYVPDFATVVQQVAEIARRGDVVITMGAGDVTVLGEQIMLALGDKTVL